MVRPSLTCLILAAAGVGSAQAVEIQQTLYGEVLIEGVFQNNYTDGNGDKFVRVDPTIYSNFGQLSTVGDQQFFSGATDSSGVFRGLLVDPETRRLLVRAQDRNVFYDDSSNMMWMRAKLGSKIQIEDRVEANISLVFDAEGGDRTHLGDPGSLSGDIQLNDANVLLRRFIIDDLHLRVGRQPVSWNLRRGHGAFLHDSRSDNPVVTSWDGARAHYNFDNFTFSPYHFILDTTRDERGLNVANRGLTGSQTSSDNTLSGLHIDWQPETGGGRLFITGAASVEKNVVVREANPLTGRQAVVGDSLINYYAGFEWELGGGLTLWGEGAVQDGDLNSGQQFTGSGGAGGIEWDVGGYNNAIIGLQMDHRTGDSGTQGTLRSQALNPNSLLSKMMTISDVDRILLANLDRSDPDNTEFRGFVAPWEGISDALIVEHERYGELSELLVGNLTALKAKVEYKFDQLNPNSPVHLKFLYAYFTMDSAGIDPTTLEERAGHFGSEMDLSVSWQYNQFTTLNLFGGVFLPGLGYRQVAAESFPNSVFKPENVRDFQTFDALVNPGGSTLSTLLDAQYPQLTDDSAITLFGINIHVNF